MVGALTSPQTSECCSKPLGVMEQLKLRKDQLSDQLTEVDATIKMFEDQPSVEQCLSQLSKLGIYR